MGRPRQKGHPLPKLRTRLEDPAARRTEITLPLRHGGLKDKTFEILSGQALRYRTGTRPKAVRWVLVRDPEGRRRQIETTFRDMRAHLGLETRRQWSDAAIERTTPVLPGLHGPVCPWPGDILARTPRSRAAAWYRKTGFTFSDAIAAVRTRLRPDGIFQRSASDREGHLILPPADADHATCGLLAEHDRLEVPPERIRRMVETLCFAA